MGYDEKYKPVKVKARFISVCMICKREYRERIEMCSPLMVERDGCVYSHGVCENARCRKIANKRAGIR